MFQNLYFHIRFCSDDMDLIWTVFHRIEEFLTFGRIIEVDQFIADLWQVHLKVKKEGYVQVHDLRFTLYQVIS